MSRSQRSISKVSKLTALFVCSLGSFFYVYEFMVRLMPSAMTHQLMATFNVHAAGLGIIASMFFYGYTPMQIPAGRLLDRFKPRRVLSVCVALCAVSTMVFSMTSNPWLAGACRFIQGFTSSFAYLGALMLASHWFNAKYYAAFAGIVQALGCVGAIVGLAPIAHMTETFGWKKTTLIMSTIGIVFTILIGFFVRDYPDTKVHKPEDESIGNTGHFAQVFKNPQTWWVAVAGFCAWAPISVFATLWGVPFLMRLYQTTTNRASLATSLIWASIALASPIVGYLSNHFTSRRIPLIACYSVGLVSALFMIYGGAMPPIWMGLALFGFGISAAAQVITFGLVLDNNRNAVMGIATGFNNMAVVMGGVILQPLAGFILRHYGAHKLLNGLPVYSLKAYHHALLTVPAVSALGIIIALYCIKETHCKRVGESITQRVKSSIQEKFHTRH